MTPDVLIETIRGISAAMKSLASSKLKTDAIVALIADKTKLSKRDIKLVLDNLDKLESIWLKK